MDPSASIQTSQILSSELLSGEHLLWSGQPLRRILFHKSDLFAIPFSLLWGGFSIFWEWGATDHFGAANPHHSQNWFFTLWGIPFIVFGQYMIWGRFFYTAWKKGRTFYAVTSKRVLVVQTAFSRKVVDGTLSGLASVTLSERSDGAGSIEFSPDPTYNAYSSRRRNNPNQLDLDLSRLAFYDITDVRQTYQLIQAQRERAQTLDRSNFASL